MLTNQPKSTDESHLSASLLLVLQKLLLVGVLLLGLFGTNAQEAETTYTDRLIEYEQQYMDQENAYADSLYEAEPDLSRDWMARLVTEMICLR